MKGSSSITHHIDGHCATITFSQPPHNALPGHLLQQLTDTLLSVGRDKSIKVIVLRSGGDRTFCAGADFNELLAIRNDQEGLAFFSGFANVINAIRSCGKIVIGVIQGKAVGGGVGIATACDLALATQYAAGRLSELAIGIGPFVIGPAVERKIGLHRFSHMSLQPDTWIPAEDLANWGMYSSMYENQLALEEGLAVLVRQFSTYSMDALKEMKKMLWAGTDHWPELMKKRAAISGRLILSPDAQQTIQNIKSK